MNKEKKIFQIKIQLSYIIQQLIMYLAFRNTYWLLVNRPTVKSAKSRGWYFRAGIESDADFIFWSHGKGNHRPPAAVACLSTTHTYRLPPSEEILRQWRLGHWQVCHCGTGLQPQGHCKTSHWHVHSCRMNEAEMLNEIYPNSQICLHGS